MMSWTEEDYAKFKAVFLVGISKQQTKLSDWEEQHGRKVPVHWLNDIDHAPKNKGRYRPAFGAELPNHMQ